MSPETSDLLLNQQSEETISGVSQTENAARPPRSASAYLSSLSDWLGLFYLSRRRSRLGPSSQPPLRPSRASAVEVNRPGGPRTVSHDNSVSWKKEEERGWITEELILGLGHRSGLAPALSPVLRLR